MIFLVQFLGFIFRDLCVEGLYCFCKHIGQVCIFIRLAGAVHAKPCAFHDHLAQHHFRVLHKIAVHTGAVFIRVQMHPIRLNIRYAVTLLQKQNITCDLRACISLESIIGKADCSNQVYSLCKVLADGGVFLIHRSLGSDKRHNTARPNLIQCLSEKVIVYQPVVFVVFLIQYLKVAKRHIADCHIKKAVGHLYLFKAGYGNGAVLIKLLGNAPGDGVQFHTVDLAACHSVREHTDKVTDATGRLQNIALSKAHL